MSFTTSIIENKEQFNLVINDFKTSARIRSNPDIYHIGLDTEYINNMNHTKSFNNACTLFPIT